MRHHSFLPLIFLICLMFVANSTIAITVDEIYRNFQTAYEQSENFSADFEQTTHYQNQRSIAKGRLIFGKPNLLRQEYFDNANPKQLSQLIILDGKTSWSYTPWLNQVTKTESNGKELLPGIGKSLENLTKNYNMELVEDEVANPKGIYRVKLSPKRMTPKSTEQGAPLPEIIEVWIRSKDWAPVQFSYKNQANDMLIVTALKNVKLNQKLDESTFKFTVPKDAEVINISPR
ncbi:MAG: outer membrane lipoprotein carrier protein LolA [Candidatus Poribacteria bacterium]